MLFKQKEQLKKDIAKKRAQLEKELSSEIAAEVGSLSVSFFSSLINHLCIQVSSLKQKAQLKLAQQGKRRREEGEQVLLLNEIKIAVVVIVVDGIEPQEKSAH